MLSAGNSGLQNATVTVTVTVTVTAHLRIIPAVRRQLLITECDLDRNHDRDRVRTLTDHLHCPQATNGFET